MRAEADIIMGRNVEEEIVLHQESEVCTHTHTHTHTHTLKSQFSYFSDQYTTKFPVFFNQPLVGEVEELYLKSILKSKLSSTRPNSMVVKVNAICSLSFLFLHAILTHCRINYNRINRKYVRVNSYHQR